MVCESTFLPPAIAWVLEDDYRLMTSVFYLQQRFLQPLIIGPPLLNEALSRELLALFSPCVSRCSAGSSGSLDESKKTLKATASKRSEYQSFFWCGIG